MNDSLSPHVLIIALTFFLAGIVKGALFPDHARRHPRVDVSSGALDIPGPLDAIAHGGRSFCCHGGAQLPVRDGRYFDLDIDFVHNRLNLIEPNACGEGATVGSRLRVSVLMRAV